MTEHNDGWGWPMELRPVLPAPGEIVETPDGELFVGPHDGWTVPLGNLVDKIRDDEQVRLEFKCDSTLRYSTTRDGLYWNREGLERDGWEMVVVRDAPEGFRRWKLSRGAT